MSGFVALLARRADADRTDLDPMLRAIDHRGRDGSGSAVHGPAALGHQRFETTPTAGVQPLRDGEVTVAVDGRIDNRRSVAAALPGDVPDDAADAALFARAYRAWDEGLLDRVVGVYGLAVWDAADGRLFCARDPTGVRPVYHATAGDAVLVASEAGALLAHPAVSPSVDEELLAAYLVGEMAPGTDTFYEGISRLPPGGVLVAEPGDEPTVSRRRNLAAEATTLDADEDALVERFRDLLSTAVACRLRTVDRPGVLMSGGLDSTSVACVASTRRSSSAPPVRSFSAVVEAVGDPSLTGAERDRIAAVTDRCGLEGHEVVVDDRWPLREPSVQERALREGPCLNALQSTNVALYREAADAGSSVLLTGHGGDLHGGSRHQYLDLLREGRLGRLVRALRADPMATRLLVLWYLLLPTVPRFAVPVVEATAGGDAGDLPAWLDDAAVDRLELGDRLDADGDERPERASMRETYESFFGTRREYHWAVGHAAALREGVELRYPFADQRLVSFVFSLPTGSRLRDGTDKRLLREAMADRLPEAVLAQSAGADFDALLTRGLRDREADRVRELLTDTRLADRGLVDGAALRETVDGYLDGGGPSSDVIWRLVTAERWLRRVDPA